MDIGEWVHKHGLAVHVGNVCFSSCANYIFPASNNKYLRKDSILGWHGNTGQESFNEIVHSGDASAVRLRSREIAFYQLVGVDQRVGTYGFDHISFWDGASAFLKNETIMGFDYSIEDMKKFGIDNVYSLDGEWDWRKYHKTAYKIVRVDVEF